MNTATAQRKHKHTFSFPKAQWENGQLHFNNNADWKTALEQGVFFVEIPKGTDIHAGIKLSQNFYKTKNNDADDRFKGFTKLSYDDSILGYSDRHDQVEQIQLEIHLWEKYFPQEVTALLTQMNKIGLGILESIFKKAMIEEKYWDIITGKASENKALQYVIFNHYRPYEGKIGITKHKDSGFITLLYSPEPGLEAYTPNGWEPIVPEKGFFTVNLGHSLEILTAKHHQKITAVDHHVREIKKSPLEPDRFSFGTYIGPRFDMNLFQYSDGNLVFYETFLAFQKWKAKQMGYAFHPKVTVK